MNFMSASVESLLDIDEPELSEVPFRPLYPLVELPTVVLMSFKR